MSLVAGMTPPRLTQRVCGLLQPFDLVTQLLDYLVLAEQGRLVATAELDQLSESVEVPVDLHMLGGSRDELTGLLAKPFVTQDL